MTIPQNTGRLASLLQCHCGHPAPQHRADGCAGAGPKDGGRCHCVLTGVDVLDAGIESWGGSPHELTQ